MRIWDTQGNDIYYQGNIEGDLSESLGALTDAMDQLNDGSSQLYDGICTLLD